MDNRAISKARNRVRAAGRALERIAQAKNHEEFSDHWYAFLSAWKNVYTSLNKGTKGFPRSAQWFGAKQQQRKDDPLLQYLFQSRDDDEHGLEPVLTHVRGSLGIGVRENGFSSGVVTKSLVINGDGISMDLESPDGKPILIRQRPPETRLVPVRGRGKILYYPPGEHLGRRLPDTKPLTVAGLGLAYVEALVIEAGAL